MMLLYCGLLLLLLKVRYTSDEVKHTLGALRGNPTRVYDSIAGKKNGAAPWRERASIAFRAIVKRT